MERYLTYFAVEKKMKILEIFIKFLHSFLRTSMHLKLKYLYINTIKC